MIKLIKRVSVISIIMAVVFMVIQVVSDLYLPTLTSNIINNGVATGDIDYIWKTGFYMIGFSLISIIAALGNTYFEKRILKTAAERRLDRQHHQRCRDSSREFLPILRKQRRSLLLLFPYVEKK